MQKIRKNMDKDSLSFSSHFSREIDESSLDQDNDNNMFVDFTITKLCDSEDEEKHYIEALMERETEFGSNKDQSLVFGNLVKRSRLEAISWIHKAREVFGFRLQTAYLSMTYFDRFLSRRSINSEEMWLIRLLPAACLALAAKMEEPKIPSLSDFRFDGDNFGSKLVERMELFVLSTLEWKMSSITPFSFLNYFIKKLSQFDQSSPTNILATATSLIMASIREINLMEHRPSSLAVAATLVALEHNLTRKSLESKVKSISHCKSIQFEDIFSCYNLMSGIKISQESYGSSTVRPRPFDVTEDSTVSDGFSNERKRVNPRNCSFECGVTGYKRFR